MTDLSKNLKTVLAKLYHGLENPDYNYVIRTAPLGCEKEEFYHWYIAIVPRLTRSAGFELGSGMYVNVTFPEDNAKFLREVKMR